MTYYLWILLFGALVIPKVQNFDLSDAVDDEKPTPKTEVKPPKANDGELTLEDALLPDPEKPNTDPKQPVAPPNSGDPKPPTSGGDFSDTDLLDGNPDTSQGDWSEDPQNDQPKELYQQWLKLLTLLGDNMPEGLHDWIANSKQVVVSLLERLMELLDLSEAEKQS
ncbi:CD99 molecule isoform X2 [Hemibagrus wyckioides]|uniref:CD99 molecule isoform X2 n=1 Tax=Hemibagrus wyckioides TaxID=337641 RepID=UPI00266BB82A|nr:CD99 molecule isoform X2 [Hemibagrus wyckioides]